MKRETDLTGSFGELRIHVVGQGQRNDEPCIAALAGYNPEK